MSEVLKQVTGECPFCGQARILKVPENFDEAQIQKSAALSCDCAEAWAYREREREKEVIEERRSEAKDNVRGLFQRDMPEVARFLMSAVDLITDGKFEQITLSAKNTRGTVKRTSGKIKVQRVDKTEAVMESDI